MKNQGYAEIILRSVRTIILIDASFTVLVGLVGFVLGWHTFESYGMGLMWAGTALIFFSCLIGMGGVSSSLEDMRAFWLSGAGNMSDNLRQISEARRSSLGCFFFLLVAGIGLLILAYLIPIIPILIG